MLITLSTASAVLRHNHGCGVVYRVPNDYIVYCFGGIETINSFSVFKKLLITLSTASAVLRHISQL